MAMPNCRECGGMLMETWDSCRFCGAALDTASAAPAPPPVLESDTSSRMPVVLAAAVAVLVAVGVFLLLRPDGEPEQAAATTEPDRSVEEFEQDNLTALTTPSATREEYVAATAAGGAEFGIPAEAWGCVAGGAVDALGGPEALRQQGVTPQDFAVGDAWSRLDAPAGAVQRLADAFPMCGIDLVDHVMNTIAADGTTDAGIVECLRGGVDPGVVNRAIAGSMLGDALTFVEGSEFDRHVRVVAYSCI